ncbi:hypothetical protein Tco_1000875 [Tanacetum coccineum]
MGGPTPAHGRPLAETIQADCDIKAINIILQGIPPEIYALMPLEQFQVNTKFLNTLPAKWSKFVTDVKLVKDLHTTNVDQIHAHLEQHERHANEVRLMHERNSDPLALVASHQMTQFPYQSHQHSYKNSQHQQQVSPYQSSQYGAPLESQQYSVNQSSTPLSITYPSNNYQSSVHHNVYSPSSSIPQLEYAPSVNQQPEFSQPDSGLIVLVFQRGDDPIDAINHVMSFLTAVVTSRYPTTNNQLRNSSNPRQQATINDGRVTLQPIRSDKLFLLGSEMVTFYREELAFWQSKNLQQVKPHKTVLTTNAAYTTDDLMPIAEVHNPDNVNNNMLNQAVQAMPSSEQSNVVNHSETKITSDSNIIPYSQYVIESQQAAVQNSNSSAQQDALILSLERYKEQVKVLKEGQNVDLRSNNNVSDSCAQSVEIDRLKQTLSEHLKEKESLMQTVILLKNDFKKEESRNIDREIALEKRIKQLDNIVFKRDQSAQTVHMLTKPQFFYDHTTKQALGFQNPFYLKKAQQLEPKLYDGNVIKNTSEIVIPDSEETLMLAEESRSKMLLKQKDPMMLEKKVNTTPVDYAVLNQLSQDFEKRFVPQTELSAEQAFWSQNSVNSPEPTLSSRPTKVEVPKELPKGEKEQKQRTAVEQYRLESKTFEVKINQVLNENERILEQVINKDIVNIIMIHQGNASVNNMNVKMSQTEPELLNKKDFVEKRDLQNCSKVLPLLKNIASL